MKAKSIESDIPGTVKLELLHWLSLMVVSLPAPLLCPLSPVLPSGQRVLSEHWQTPPLSSQGSTAKVSQKWTASIFQKSCPDAVSLRDLCVLAQNYHIIAFQHAPFPKIPLKAFPSDGAKTGPTSLTPGISTFFLLYFWRGWWSYQDLFT